MGIAAASTMTVEEFYTFTDTRPDEEKWELIGGEPVLNAAANTVHGKIVANITTALSNREREIDAFWTVVNELGVRISDHDRPEADLAVITGPALGGRDRRNEIVVIFEVLSSSTTDRDLTWKRKVYTSLPSLTHYVVVAQDAIEATVFARDNGFKERVFHSREDVIDIHSLDASLSLADIYYRT